MKRFIFSSLLLIAISSSGYAKVKSDVCPSCYIEERISPHNGRFHTFTKAIELMRDRNVKVIVETGTSRNGDKNCSGDGCSTLIYGIWAKEHGAVLYSVDINLEFLQSAEMALGSNASSVRFMHEDSVSFLRNFNQTIDFLYLDSYDYEAHNPRPSQLHHLYEIIAAYPWLTDNSVVMIDDCNLPNGGKGKDAIEFLLSRGWRIIENRHQVILIK